MATIKMVARRKNGWRTIFDARLEATGGIFDALQNLFSHAMSTLTLNFHLPGKPAFNLKKRSKKAEELLGIFYCFARHLA